jgi:Family of unknown function (DUF5906)
MADEFDGPTSPDEAKANKAEVLSTLKNDKVVKLVQPAKEEPKDDNDGIPGFIAELSQFYATVLKDVKFKVIDESIPGKVKFLDKREFLDNNADDKVTTFTTNTSGDSKSKIESKAKMWLEHPKHRKYRSVIFDPSRPFHRNDLDYNMWPGFSVAPQKGSCYQFLKYVRAVVCNGNKNEYRWLMAWTAQMFQKPWEKPETAVAIQSEEEGTGKSFFPVVLSRLLHESSYFVASNPRMITGDFTGHLEHTLLLHAEECFRAESEREDSIIKNLISDEKMPVNAKGIQAKLVKSYIRMIMTGNPPHIVKAGQYARRFLVLKILNKYRMNTEYFKKILHELEHGGYEALMYYLMHYPIDKFNLRVVIKTAGLLEQQIESMKGEYRFWYVCLYNGELPFIGTSHNKYYRTGDLEYHVIKHKLIGYFQRFMSKKVEKNRSDEVTFGIQFAKFFPVLNDKGNIIYDNQGKQMKYLETDRFEENNHYIIPELTICRKLFDACYEQSFDWPDNKEWKAINPEVPQKLVIVDDRRAQTKDGSF